MNKKIKIEIAVGIIVAVAIIVGGYVWMLGKKESSVAQPVQVIKSADNTGKSVCANDNSSISEIVSIDSEWNKYTNRKLGFSVDIPKEAFFQGETEREKSCISVLESDKRNIVYVVPAGDSKFNDFIAPDTTNDWTAGTPFMAIRVIDNIKNKNELDSYIKKHFGKTCVLDKDESEVASGDVGYTLGVAYRDINDPFVGCEKASSSWNWYFRYSPKKQKLAYWRSFADTIYYKHDGMDVPVKLSDGTYTSLDLTDGSYEFDMYNSFKFED